MSQKRHTVDQIIAKLRPADVLLGKGTKVPELCKQLELPPAFSAKKISGTVYTKLGVAGGARVPPWTPRSDHPPRVDSVNPSERRSLPPLCLHRTISGRQASSPEPSTMVVCYWCT